MKTSQRTPKRWHKPLQIASELLILIPLCYIACNLFDVHQTFLSVYIICPPIIAIAIDELLQYKNI